MAESLINGNPIALSLMKGNQFAESHHLSSQQQGGGVMI